MGMMVPEKWGGAGLDTISYTLAIEEIAAVELATSTIMSVNNSLVCQALLDWGNDLQKKEYLVPLASGLKLGAYSLSEPESGSDARKMKTYAEKVGSDYLINGTKNWVTSGHNSDFIIFFCRTNLNDKKDEVSAFIIDKNTTGLSLGKKEDKLGLRASDTCQLYFENCKLPKENRIGDEGQGFSIAMNALGGGRIGIAAQAVGLARTALEKAISYSKERKQFGRPISSFGAIQNKLADIATNVQSARLLVWQAAYLKDSGASYIKESSMAKLFASSAAMSAASECVQIHGGYGYIQEYGIERLMRDAKVTEIYEGTSEIQRLVISRELLK
jgi:alkylation response protein AidB-like acyl-CoA dehydrogenase